MHPRRRDPWHERGSVTVWTVVVIPTCLLVVGLVLDGGAILRSRSTTFDLAAGAARAAAQHLDQNALAVGQVRIDDAAAQSAVDQYLAGTGTTGQVQVRGNRVSVTVHAQAVLQILRPATVAIEQTATATAVQPGGP